MATAAGCVTLASSPVSKLLWFHAFNRDTVKEVIDVLRSGPGFNPKPTCRTRLNEARLGLPPHVYAYIGTTVPTFGDAGFAIPLDAFDGEMSPFDTGGLVDHTPPVSGWDDAEKQKYLADYTWKTRNRRALLAKYPTLMRARVLAYLSGKKPAHDGPHAVWSKTVAAIWKTDAAGWQSWTWEGRTPMRMKLSGPVHAWSCTAPIYEKVCEYAESVASGAEQRFLDELLDRYVRGGVSHMVAELREEQAA